VQIWKISARLWVKRHHNLLPQLVESLEHHGHLQLKQFMKAWVLTISSTKIEGLV
jgi:hypothetical protein